MSILIKDMEMPKSCTLCELLKNDRSAFYCPVQSKEANLKANLLIELYANCPLVELPPHGRLIDADVAYDEFLNLMKIQGAIDPCQLGRILVCAPTIIEAEDSFFNSLKRGLEQAINGDVREMTIIEAEDDGYFTAEEQKLKWDVIYNKSQKTGININDIIESEGEND